ncbi:TIR-NBS-LRR type disease resistance protein, partial [Trifolium medium]|nr:TIR-NBS-LRR type disease resistance protein [Trifolium medium]
MEETFDMPLQLDLNKAEGSNTGHIWLIYISRPHCHFVTTGAMVTFKAHPDVELKTWGLRMVFEHDIYSSFELGTDEVHQPGYLHLNHVHEHSSSKRPEVQLPYN